MSWASWSILSWAKPDCPVSLGSGRSWFSFLIQMRSLVTVSVRTVTNNRTWPKYVLGGWATKIKEYPGFRCTQRFWKIPLVTSSLLFRLKLWPSYKSQSLPRTEQQVGEGPRAQGPISHAGNGQGTQEARRIENESRRRHQWDACPGWGQRQTQPRTKHCGSHCVF